MKQPSRKIEIVVGLQFTSWHFSPAAKIIAIRKDDNECDVELTPSDGHAYVEKNWNLQHVRWAFENEEYEVKDNKEVNYHFI